MKMKFPVMLHHWGRNGASWTINSTLLSRYSGVTTAVRTLMLYYDRTSYVEQVVTAKEFCLAVTVEPDLNCVDPKAKDRRPFIMKVAFLDSPNLEDWNDKLTAIFQALKTVTPSPDYDNQDQMEVTI